MLRLDQLHLVIFAMVMDSDSCRLTKKMHVGLAVPAQVHFGHYRWPRYSAILSVEPGRVERLMAPWHLRRCQLFGMLAVDDEQHDIYDHDCLHMFVGNSAWCHASQEARSIVSLMTVPKVCLSLLGCHSDPGTEILLTNAD